MFREYLQYLKVLQRFVHFITLLVSDQKMHFNKCLKHVSFHNLTETTLKQKPQAARTEARSCYRTQSDSKHSIHTCPHQKSHSLTIYGFTACSGKHSVLFGCSEHTMRRTQLNPLYIENTSDEKWHFFFSNYARLRVGAQNGKYLVRDYLNNPT